MTDAIPVNQSYHLQTKSNVAFYSILAGCCTFCIKFFRILNKKLRREFEIDPKNRVLEIFSAESSGERRGSFPAPSEIQLSFRQDL
jgi:hypothetical protein